MREQAKLRYLEKLLRSMGFALVAFSGGVDSALLLTVASKALANQVLAVTIKSPLVPESDLLDARCTASLLDVDHLIVSVDELQIPGFTENRPDRCYLCKKHRFSLLVSIAKEKQIPQVIEGTNADDSSDFRPGLRAIKEFKEVRSPLREAGLSKEEIRLAAKRLGVPIWDKPSSGCLATRIPYGTSITLKKLRQIEKAEVVLRSCGIYKECRVRYLEDHACIEVSPEYLSRVITPSIRNRVLREFRSLGFHRVSLDLEGYRTGSLSQVNDRYGSQFL